jgi:hypothetical protein
MVAVLLVVVALVAAAWWGPSQGEWAACHGEEKQPHLRSARSVGAGAPRARPLRRSSTIGKRLRDAPVEQKNTPPVNFSFVPPRRVLHVCSQTAGAQPAGQAVENHTDGGVWNSGSRGVLGQCTHALTTPSPGLFAQVSLSAFAFLFSELVQYNQSRVSSVTELERKCVARG